MMYRDLLAKAFGLRQLGGRQCGSPKKASFTPGPLSHVKNIAPRISIIPGIKNTRLTIAAIQARNAGPHASRIHMTPGSVSTDSNYPRQSDRL